MDKESLRAYYKEKRNAIPKMEKAALDEHITTYLMQYDFSSVRLLHIFLPISKWNEFNTFSFIQWLRKHHTDIAVVVSMTDIAQGTLKHYAWQGEKLEENAWGIPELILQEDSREVTADAIDLVFVPLLVCDMLGNRIGYGKGFYDRFLLDCRKDVQKMGISYFPPLEQPIAADSWDVPLDGLVSPVGIVDFTLKP